MYRHVTYLGTVLATQSSFLGKLLLHLRIQISKNKYFAVRQQFQVYWLIYDSTLSNDSDEAVDSGAKTVVVV